ncbi:NO-inducible flavohemoprotein [Parathalassolituus penaei]|uniref:nitric oxide dioxygenase n=1 Tax=Parathalassolituus penaei TaxID=2997323 RepID=A0A9X3ITK3_9GAMM|nr:NO-inducible flavohemoprotein [Parathalassolituus penaei]MCY0965273.1 NO-inducible flavohemoprotein [Parathalassolituus penaei]
MLSQQHIEIVKSTIPLLEQAGPALTEHFYKRMFSHNPELLNVFNRANQRSGRQALALFEAVAAWARYLDTPEVLVDAVERIANKHASLDIQPHQYAIVGGHLLATLRELAAEQFTSEVEAAWTAAYDLLADILIRREEAIYQQNEQQNGGWRGRRRFRLLARETESALVSSLWLTPVDGGVLPTYQPGQYLGLELQPEPHGYRAMRQYSLSTCWQPDRYRISVKREAHGLVSGYLHDVLQIGDELDVLAPVGDFVKPVGQAPLVLISAGVGVTPLMAMLESEASENNGRQLWWLHACANAGQHSFRERVEQLAGELPLQTVCWYEEAESGSAQQRAGRMNLSLMAGDLPLLDGEFCLCGPVAFMQVIHQELIQLGVDAGRIHYEVFGPHARM